MASSTAVKKKIVVAGGNGFLGSRICKAASARGWDVTSISRSGEPTWSSVTSSPDAPTWSKDVTWVRANILSPSTYRAHLAHADYVVHTMGILLEADYKGVLQGKESPVAGLRRAFSPSKQGTANPLAKRSPSPSSSSPSSSSSSSPSSTSSPDVDNTTYEPLEQDSQITYEVMNRDSAILLAREASTSHVPTFAYISAAGGAPVLPRRYIDTKRAAESSIATNFPSMRSLFFRPGMLFDSSRAFTLPLAAGTWVGAMANSVTGGLLGGFLGAGGVKPLKADVVAEAVVEGLSEDGLRGPVEVRQIEELATKVWRRGML